MHPAAARERDLREKHWPEEVAAGRMSATDAEADMAAWRAIAELAEGGSCTRDLIEAFLPAPARDLDLWRFLEGRAADALQRREQALAERPGDGRLRERRDLVAVIHAGLAAQREIVEARSLRSDVPDRERRAA
jgi:hypothetical protein